MRQEIDIVIKRLRLEDKHVMVTTCEHKFHTRCLLEWIEKKA